MAGFSRKPHSMASVAVVSSRAIGRSGSHLKPTVLLKDAKEGWRRRIGCYRESGFPQQWRRTGISMTPVDAISDFETGISRFLPITKGSRSKRGTSLRKTAYTIFSIQKLLPWLNWSRYSAFIWSGYRAAANWLPNKTLNPLVYIRSARNT
jgi:hypothetical protein